MTKARDISKLSAVEADATADQTNAEVKAAVEAASDSNTFTDADHSKLNAIEASADVTDTANVTSSGALMDSELTNLAAVKAINQSLVTTADATFASLDISGNIDVDGVTNLDVVDIDGAVDMASTLGVTGVLTANAGVVVDNFTLDGTTLALSSGDLTLDAAGVIVLDADNSGVIQFKDNGTRYGTFFTASNAFNIQSHISDGDIIFSGNDGGSTITALTLDMSAAGAATFNAGVTANPSGGVATLGANGHITSKQSLDVATAGGRYIGSSNRGLLGQLRIEQTAQGADGGYVTLDTCAVGSTSPTERMRIHSGGVVSVPVGIELGSGVDATAANTLNDYEEGTWTSAFTIPSGSVAYNTGTRGVYTKIGRMVHVNAWIYVGALSSPSGTLTIILPFANAGNARASQLNVVNRWTGVTGQIGCWLSGNSTSLNFLTLSNGTMGGSALNGTNMQANCEMYLNFSYETS